LVKSLLKIDQENQYVFFGSSLRRRKELNSFIEKIKSKNTSSAIYPFPPSFLEFLLNRVRICDIQNFIGKVDVFHSSDWIQPKTSAKKVTTVHDLAFFKFPELFHPKIVAVQKRRLELVRTECDRIIAVSQNTKKDLVEILKIPEDKIKVIYEAASDDFKLADKKEVEKIKNKFGIRKEYILTVATFGARKNLPKLIEAYGLIKKEFDLNLVIAGSLETINRKDIIATGFLEDKGLISLYTGAKVFVYNSVYEGFGLPVLEAMACGVPVVCSATSSLPEVGGEAAVYVDPNSTKDIASGIKKTLQYSKPEYETIRKKSQEQAKKFFWEKTATDTLKVYQELK